MLCNSMLFAASLRDYVCVIRPNLSQNTVDFLTEYKDELISKGYKNYASNIESFLQGSFGSGFIYYASNGKPYIVTNRHVIFEAESANAQFENEDGSVSEYKDLKIIAIDEDIDIALLALPDNFKKAGLLLADSKINEGDDVWSAGFPGLGDEPVWQLGKGVVSNASARIKELLSPDISTLIQHSAQIDAGNSGGPLMIKDSKKAAGYSVIGINTWKAVYRENTNYAIPAAVIKKFVENAIGVKNNQEDFAKRIEMFNKAIRDKDVTYKNMSRFVSNQMINDCGKDVFVTILQKASVDVRSYIINAFAYDPIEGMRYAIAYTVWKKFQSSDGVLDYKTGEAEKSEFGYTLLFALSDTESVESIWMSESGLWKLKDFNKLCVKEKTEDTSKKKNKKASNSDKKVNTKENFGEASVTLEDDYDMSITGGYIIPSKGLPGGFNFEFNYAIEYVSFGAFFQSETIPLAISDDWGNYQNTEDTKMNTFGLGIRLQLPVNFTYVIVEPYIDAKFGFSNFMQIFDNKDRIYTGFGAGVDFIFNGMSDSIAPVIGVKYIHSGYKSNKSDRFAIEAGIKLGSSGLF